MRLLLTFLLPFFLLGFSTLQAQVAKDATVPLSATIAVGPPSITLNWTNPGNANLVILRRTKGQAGNSWQQVISLNGTNLTSLIDNGVSAGQIYEYVIQRTLGTIVAFGYAHVAINANPVNTRGKILIFVDSTTADALGVELIRLKNDMRGDGWWPIAFHTGPSSTVQSIKNQIIASYNADPVNVKSVLLLGTVPIPYSGNTNWDGHLEHAGAWPADAYYADVNGVWTDTLNNITPARAANVNIPGDGKFDQSFLPTAAELQVGRVDFRRINAAAFGAADQIGLMKRYLDKNHKWRIGDYAVQNKALVDDNFGYFNGAAFAANGFRNAYPLVGEANVVEADFFADTNPQSYLLGYGAGGGTYQSAGGVGSSADFAVDSVNIVFSNLFGSYHGDWDFESDPFMPSALASRGGILTCSWAGRPHWFNQALASGETIGYCSWETMNAQFNNGFFGSYGESGAHVALLGDPTLRANVVKPATNLALTAPTCSSVALSWTASADAVAGYHVYRALSQDGSYIRLTTTPVSGTTYTDNAPALDTLYYQVRAIKNVTNPGGGTYANNAIGPIKSIVFVAAGGPTVVATGGTLNCTNFNVTLTASATPPTAISWNWTGPNNFSSSLQNPVVTNIGIYTVTAFDAAGCSSTATTTVLGDYTPPVVSATVSNTITCTNTSAVITVSSAGLLSSIITGPGNTFVQGFTATVTLPGTYNISAVSSTNGCLANSSVQVVANLTPPPVTASNTGPLTCVELTTSLIATSNVPGTSIDWSGPCVNGSTASCAGVYTVVATSAANGCTNSATTTVLSDTNLPLVDAHDGLINCVNLSFPLTATVVNVANPIIQWSGPCVSGGPQSFFATCPGSYTVVVTNPDNGCSASATVLVVEDVQLPNISFPPVAPISCAVPCAGFSVPNIPGIEIYIGGQLIPPGTLYPICQPGVYVGTLKSLVNGCTNDFDIVVLEDIIPPMASAGPNVTLSCIAPTAILTSAGSSVGATFSLLWTGPGGYSSTQINAMVSVAGTYTLTVVNTMNGCTATDQVVVFADASLPTVDATASGQLNCLNPTVQLQSGNNNPDALFVWTPTVGLSCSNCPNPVASAPGTYVVLVSVGACTATDAVEVIQANLLSVTYDPVVLGCDGVSTHCANVQGGTPPYVYLWSNGGTSNCTVYNAPDTVSIKITDAGGCNFQSGSFILPEPPVVVIDYIVVHESAPNANNGAIILIVSGGFGFTFSWSTGATTEDLVGLAGGVYTVTITDAIGCTYSASVIVNTPVSIEEEVLFEQFLLSPNPTAGIASLSLKLHETSAIRVEIRDMAGRMVWEQPTQVTQSFNLPIDLTNSPAGMYTISVWVENQVFVRKLAVVR